MSLSQLYKIDEDLHDQIVTSCRDKAGIFNTIQLKGYHKEIVKGLNYYLKVDVNEKEYWIKVHQGLPSYGSELSVVEALTKDEFESKK